MRDTSTIPQSVLQALASSQEEACRKALSSPEMPPPLAARFAALSLPESEGFLPMEELFALAALGSWPRVWVIQSRRTPIDLLPALVDETALSAIRAVQRRPAPPAFLREMLQRALQRKEKERLYLSVLQELGSHPSLPPGCHELLLEAENPEGYFIHANVARNPTTPLSVLEKLWTRYLQQGDTAVASSLAENPNARSEWLLILRQHPSYWVRARCVSNPTLPDESAETLLSDEHHVVRARLAERPSLSASVMEQLSQDRDSLVRSNLSKRHDLPPNAAARLLEDLSPSIAKEAQERYPSILEEGARLRRKLYAGELDAAALASFSTRGPRAAWEVLLYEKTPPALRLKIAEDEPSLFELLSHSELLTEEILRELSASPRGRVRVAVAHHPKTPLDVLLRLAADAAPQVIKALRHREEKPEALVRALQKKR